MKKAFVILAVTGCLIAAGFGIMFVLNSQTNYSSEDLLPAKPIFYIRSKHLNQRIDKFLLSQLYQDLKKIDYRKAAGALGSSQKMIQKTQAAWDNAFSDENLKMLKALFGNEVTVAVYPLGENQSGADLVEHVFIVTRISPDLAAAEAVAQFWGTLSKDSSVQTKNYKGKKINVIQGADGKLTIGYVLFENYAVMGIGLNAAQSAIDVLAQETVALSADQDYLKRKMSFFDESETVGYFDIKSFYPMLANEIARMAKTKNDSLVLKTQLQTQLNQIKGFDVLVFSGKSGDTLNFKVDLFYDHAALNPELKVLYSCGPQNNNSAKFVPRDALVYQWNTCLDFTQIWTKYKEQMSLEAQVKGQKMDVSQVTGIYGKILGISFDRDVLPVLGNEFGMYLTDIDLSGAIPLPKIVFFIETHSPQRSDELLNKLFALQPSLQVQEEKYLETTIRFIPIPVGENFATSYTYIGKTLLISSNIDALKASLDAAKDINKSISRNLVLMQSDPQINSVFYIQVDGLLRRTDRLLDWANQAAKDNQIQDQAFLAGSRRNLFDIRAKIDVLQEDINAKESRISELSSAGFDPLQDPQTEITTVQTELDRLQKELTVNQEKEKTVAEQVAAYESKIPQMGNNEEMTKLLAKPLIHALSNIRYFNVTTVNRPGVLGSTVKIKID